MTVSLNGLYCSVVLPTHPHTYTRIHSQLTRLYRYMHGAFGWIVEYREMDTKSSRERNTAVIPFCNIPTDPFIISQSVFSKQVLWQIPHLWQAPARGGKRRWRIDTKSCTSVRKTVTNYKEKKKKKTGTGSRIWMQFMWILLERALRSARKQHNKDSLSGRHRIKSVEDGHMAEWSPEASSPVCLVLLCDLQDPSQVPADCAQSRDSGNRPVEDVEMEEPLSVTRPLNADWHLGCRLVSCCFFQWFVLE